MRILVVTNDFPPRVGGIEDYVARLIDELPPDDSVVVLGPPHPEAAAFDRSSRHDIRRWSRGPMLPTPPLARAVRQTIEREGIDVLVFGATLPLALMAGRLRRRGHPPVVACTHGVEPALGSTTVGRPLLGYVARHASIMTVVSRWAEVRVRRSVGRDVRLEWLPSGVDVDRFRPDVGGDAIRARYGLDAGPVIVSLSRLVRRKGIDRVIGALPGVASEHPGARLLIVGGGPDRGRLERIARARGVSARIVFAGEVPPDDVPGCLAAGDIFALPCRARLGGLEDEALGAVFLQAAAVGRPAVAGRTGGVPEAVVDGRTGVLVDDGADSVRAALLDLLRDPDHARAIGRAAAERVHREWSWSVMGRRFRDVLESAVRAGDDRRVSGAGG